MVNAAEVAKGTFYVHFDGLDDLQNAVADELAREFDDLLQPRRLSLDDPLERIAAGCEAFLNEALHDPAWAALIARGAAAMPGIARVVRGRLHEDIRRAAATGRACTAWRPIWRSNSFLSMFISAVCLLINPFL